jgi:hypothetical protein
MIHFTKITIDSAYAKKWNVDMNDFIVLTNDEGNPIRNTLYRKGGMGGTWKDGYCELIKYIEEEYSDSITKIAADKPHLAGHWCIINEKGEEKVVTKQFEYIYHQGGIIYSINNTYYNIETGEVYCKGNHSISSSQFIFADNIYHTDKEKMGIWKINKFDGTYEIFK